MGMRSQALHQLMSAVRVVYWLAAFQTGFTSPAGILLPGIGLAVACGRLIAVVQTRIDTPQAPNSIRHTFNDRPTILSFRLSTSLGAETAAE